MQAFVFVFSALLVLGGAFGVILGKNPVRCALSLVLTLFGVAILFISLEANFLAAVQVSAGPASPAACCSAPGSCSWCSRAPSPELPRRARR
jgi:hypothetical protein